MTNLIVQMILISNGRFGQMMTRIVMMIVTKSKMLIRIILGSYLQFGGTVSRGRRGQMGWLVGSSASWFIHSHFSVSIVVCGSAHTLFQTLLFQRALRGRSCTWAESYCWSKGKLKQPASKCVGVDGNIRNKIIKIKSVDFFVFFFWGGANCKM